MRSERAVRVLLCDGVHVRRRAFLDGIALQAFLGSDTPTIMHAIPAKKIRQHSRKLLVADKTVT